MMCSIAFDGFVLVVVFGWQRCWVCATYTAVGTFARCVQRALVRRVVQDYVVRRDGGLARYLGWLLTRRGRLEPPGNAVSLAL